MQPAICGLHFLWAHCPAMNVRIPLLSGLLGLIVGLTACSSTKTAKTADNPGSTIAAPVAKLSADEAKRAEAFARFAAGISHDLTASPDEALEEFERSAALDPSNETLTIELAQRYLQLRKPQKAAAILTKNSSRPDTSAKVFSLLGRANLFSGATNDAIKASERALQKDPVLMEAYQNLAEIHFRTGSASNSLAIIHRAAAQTNADALFLTGVADLYADYLRIAPKETNTIYPRIRATLKRALDLKPESPVVLTRIADLSLLVNEQQQAASIYEELVEDLDESPLLRDAIREKLANFHLRQGNKDKARAQFEAIVRDNPTRYPQAYYTLGVMAYDAKDFAKAAGHFRNVLLLNPNFEQVYYDLSGMLLGTQKPKDALTVLGQARSRFPRSFTVDYLSSMAYSQMKDFTNAVKFLSSAELLAKTGDTRRLTGSFYFQLGAAYERVKDFPKAEEYMLKSLELEPESVETLNYLGYMWAERGEKLERAQVMIEKAVKKQPDSAAYLDSLAWVYFKQGKVHDALKPMLRAVELSEEPDATLFDHLGDIQFANGNRNAARKAWEKSLEIEPNPDIKKKLKDLTGS